MLYLSTLEFVIFCVHTILIQALQALAGYVRTQTSAKDRISFLGLETEAGTINHWLEAAIEFCTQADPPLMVNAARDLAFTLAHVYIGK